MLLLPFVMAMLFVSCEKGPKVDMVKIPGTNFKMLKTEVTQKLYVSVMGNNPSEFKGTDRPVENVSWYDAVKFCNELSMKKGLFPVYTINGEDVTWDKSASGFRLPTVSEWEYAARGRGGKDYKDAGSNNIEDYDEVAWYMENSNGQTHPVAKKKANSYGLYDMSGNVIEWCWDYVQYKSGRPGRRYSGTSWKWEGMTSEYADKHDNTIGFRIVRNIK